MQTFSQFALALATFTVLSACHTPAPVAVDAHPTPTPAAHEAHSAFGRKLQQALETAAAGMPGAVMHVESPAHGTWAGATGYLDPERRVPMAADAPMRIGSITKTYTAALVLLAVEDGKWSLDDPIARHLPPGRAPRLPHLEVITLRQCLNHTSGLFDYTDDQAFKAAMLQDGARARSVDELLAAAARNQPAFAPGEGVAYCNTSYLLLGLALEQAYGQSFSDLVAARLTVPLGLKRTEMPASEVMPGGVRGFLPARGADPRRDSTAFHPSLAGTGGGMVATAGEVATFMRAVLDGDLLRPASREAMKQLIPAGRPQQHYGLGLEAIEMGDAMLVGKGGAINGFSSLALRLPDGTMLVVWANEGPGGQASQLAMAAIEALGQP